MKSPVVDYRKLRPKNLFCGEFRHLRLLLFWPIFGALFWTAERLLPVEEYHVMYCPLDDRIPFCEIFLIPYLFWFVYMVGMHLYTLLYDLSAFRRMMYFIILTYSVTLLVYYIYPTCQNLRPDSFARENLFTAFIGHFYSFDTSTNVCPSMHVIGALSVLFTSFRCKTFRKNGWRIFFWITAILICLSTVFLKQHSVLDIVWALPICLVGYMLFFSKRSDRFLKES